MLHHAGSKMDPQDELGWTPVMWAAMEGHIEVVRFFLNVGADTSSIHGGWSALHLAVLNNQDEMCHELLRNGADWKMPNLNGQRCEDLANQAGFQKLELFFRGMRETTEYELKRATLTKTAPKRLKSGHYAADL